ncbi:MAG: FG-GAP-like repeat-containing protein [Planctomycetaceae bacterium]
MKAIPGPNRWQDGFVIFDYKNQNDFKYAGMLTGQNQWVIGHYQGSFNNPKVVVDWDDQGKSINPNQNYALRLRINGSSIFLRVNDQLITSYNFGLPLNQGKAGFAANNAVTIFDNYQINAYDKLLGDVAVSIDPSQREVRAGELVTYQITVKNQGPRNVFDTRNLFNSYSQLSNLTWTARFTGGAAGRASGTGEVNETVSLPVEASVIYTITGRLKPTTAEKLSVSFTAQPTSVIDFNPANNTAGSIKNIVQTSLPGSGYFGPGLEVFPGSNMSLIAAGDIDGDGDLDVIGNDLISSTGQIWFNNGDGTFVKGMQSFNKFNAHLLADFDGDGDLDLFMTGVSTAGKFVWLNDGSGRFTSTTQTFTIEDGLLKTTTRFLEAADFDADGDIDILTRMYSSSSSDVFKILENDGSGIFTVLDGGSRFSNGPTPIDHVEFADINGDGTGDLVYVVNGTLYVAVNDGDGYFQPEAQETLNNLSTSHIMAGDLDSDNHIDVVIMGRSFQPIIFLNDGSGNLTLQNPDDRYSSTSNNSNALIDLDNDGDLDIVSFSSTPNTFINDGNGNFKKLSTTIIASSYSSMFVGDFDGDGIADLLTSKLRKQLNILPLLSEL